MADAMPAYEAAVAESQGEDGRLRDAGGIACPAEQPARDGRAGARRHDGCLLEALVVQQGGELQ